jgi:hypothetical protein
MTGGVWQLIAIFDKIKRFGFMVTGFVQNLNNEPGPSTKNINDKLNNY